MVLEVKNTGISSDLVKDVVTRTLRFRVEEIKQKLTDIYENLNYFERKYGMKTAEFYTKFVSGALGDDMDFFEWKASKEIYDELKEEKRVLVEAIE
ncbi:MAG: hypothetical protein C5S38_07990 [Candidatus Methanophagaceae archaeon]|nr:MAG: hypothetical protein C5S38_07990 [Methanophagales archaeon]